MPVSPGHHIRYTIEELERSNTRLRDALILAGFRLADAEKETRRLKIILAQNGLDSEGVSRDN